jgi:hypothetical protein
MKKFVGATLLGWLAAVSQSLAAPPPTVGVPEIDATGALTGLAILAGMLAVVAERRRQK